MTGIAKARQGSLPAIIKTETSSIFRSGSRLSGIPALRGHLALL